MEQDEVDLELEELVKIRHLVASIRSYIAFIFWAGLLLGLAGAGCSVLNVMANLP